MNLLEFKNVSFKDGDDYVLDNINVSINHNDFISIVGPSGSGKSTFLKLCNNLINPTKGSILFNGENILNLNPINIRKDIGYCFQTPYLFGNTVMENLTFPFEIRSHAVDNSRLKCLFRELEMDEKIIKSKVTNLSGGEKQRLALIRTLIYPPKILLLDEVTSALDEKNTIIVEKAINKLHKEEDLTILWITHNKIQSTKYANKLLTIENGTIKSLEVLR